MRPPCAKRPPFISIKRYRLREQYETYEQRTPLECRFPNGRSTKPSGSVATTLLRLICSTKDNSASKAHRGVRVYLRGESWLAAELIHVLTRREEFGFIPSDKKLFFRIARHCRDDNNGSTKTTTSPYRLSLVENDHVPIDTSHSRRVRLPPTDVRKGF
jgi:hypothetical protein